MMWKLKTETSLVKWNDWWLEPWKEEIQSACKRASLNDDFLLRHCRSWAAKQKNVENEMRMREVNDDGYEVIQLPKSGDQRNAKKEKIKT